MSRSSILAVAASCVLSILTSAVGLSASPAPAPTEVPATPEGPASTGTSSATVGPNATLTPLPTTIIDVPGVNDPPADLWVAGYGAGGSPVHRFDGGTGDYLGSFDASVDPCTWTNAGPVTPDGLWVRGIEPRAGEAEESPSATDFCAAYFPFDGGPPIVAMMSVEPGKTLFEQGAFGIGEDLWVVGAVLPPEGGALNARTMALYRFAPDHSVQKVQGIVSATGGSDGIWGVQEKGGDHQAVRIDPKTGKVRRASVGGSGFSPNRVAGGGGHVVYQGFLPSGPSMLVLDGATGKQVGDVLVGRSSMAMPYGLQVDEDSIFGVTSGSKGTDLLAAPVEKHAKLKRVARCKDCFYQAIGQVPGAVWYTTLGKEGGSTPTIQRFDSMTRTLDATVEQDPWTPAGFLTLYPTGELPALPPPQGPAEFSSPAFAPGGPIPGPFTCGGPDVSPPLAWSDGAAEYGLVVRDLSAGGFVHWVVTGIPAGTLGLPEGASNADGLVEGVNDFGDPGWGGPCPPSGKEHKYEFTLIRSPKPLGLGLGLGSDVTAAKLFEAALAAGATGQTFIGTYMR